ncbi:hypothetical protein P3T37_002419 [Kitasatospora sp. MAA4]|uniref:DUF6087 family protein n=1 Tax=Kitasatospora sp. MAA4 TaxID=3035093 RepID=UPI0024739406|nr:DUF6087 family protein [Kitasatospora sp. MAA4]MDH6133025.1 hypothetical protein [Kitasatospora sp. MAA4]
MEESEIPLERWLELRDAGRPQVGERRAVHADGSRRAAHVNPDAPRLILEWDGHTWSFLTIAPDYKTAAGMLGTVKAGTGKHRKP